MGVLNKKYGIFNLINLIYSGCIVIVIFGLSNYIGLSSSYLYKIENVKEYYPKKDPLTLEKIDTIYNLTENALKYNNSLFFLTLIDMIIRISIFFILCCFIQFSGLKILINILIIITFILEVCTIIMDIFSYNKFPIILKNIEDNLNVLNPYVEILYNSIKEEITYNIIILVLVCIIIPSFIISSTFGYCCGGITILGEEFFAKKRLGVQELSEIREDRNEGIIG